ncbi:MAG: PAS domain-containing sensor histidine kinase [Magnetovibrionaceae bacterium]
MPDDSLGRSSEAAAKLPKRSLENDQTTDPATVIQRLEARIQELEAKETRLKESEERFQLAMKGPNEGLWDWNPQTKELYLSARLLSILGLAEETVRTTSHEWLTWIYPDDRAGYESEVVRHLKGETDHFQHEYRVVDRTGRYRWVLARGLAVRDETGVATRMVGSIGDITHIKAREDRIRQSEKRFREVIRTAGSIILVLGSTGTIEAFNDLAEKIFGRSADSVVGRHWSAVLPSGPEEPFGRAMSAALAGSRIHGLEQSIIGEGAERDLLWNISPIEADDGVSQGLVLTAQDITKRKWAEALLKQTNDELEERVAERTAALTAEILKHQRTEERLVVAKEQAEIANRAKSEFLANMSHELRTPLNAILGFSDAMRNELMGPLGAPAYQEYVGDIHASGAHLLEIINDILDIAKVEAGRCELRIETVEIETVINACTRLILTRAQEAHLSLDVKIPSELPKIPLDPLRLKQVFINILSNAVKFTEAGGSITVAAERLALEDGGDGLQVSVEDTGIGMSEEGLKTAMEAFGQVDSKLSRRFEGTGLGLPLSKALVELHGGRLSVRSKPGEGTCISVWLPLSSPVQQSLA